MIADSVELVMFALRSSLKLGRQLRQAYVDSTQRRELILPLPDFFSTPDVGSAANYFDGPGAGFVAQSQRLGELLQKRRTPGKTLTSSEEAEVLTFHAEFFNLDLARRGKLGSTGEGTTLSGDEFNALIAIRQWQRGTDPNPSALQRLAGTFIEIGVDYLGNVPGALHRDSREGRVIAGFLSAMNEIQFSQVTLGDLPGRLFVAALDMVCENSELLTADPKVQELVKVTTKSMSADVSRRLDQPGAGDLVQAQRVGDWAELVFRSVLSSAGGLVLSEPRRFLGIEQEGPAAVVSQVGESVLGLVLDADDVKTDRLFSRKGLETVVQTSLVLVGEHPEILVRSNNTGLRKLLSAIATELSGFDTLLTPDLLPEFTRLILEKTGRNLPLLWPDLAVNPQKHLLLAAADTTLSILTRQPAAGQKWTVQFRSTDLLTVAEAVLDELATNPTWLLSDAGALNDNLKLALDAALGAVRDRADERLSSATAAAVLRAVVTRVGLRKEFFDQMPGGRTLVAATLDAMLGSIFDEQLDARAAWQLVRSETIQTLVSFALTRLAGSTLNPDKVTALAAFMKRQTASLANGEPLDVVSFETKLRDALAA